VIPVLIHDAGVEVPRRARRSLVVGHPTASPLMPVGRVSNLIIAVPPDHRLPREEVVLEVPAG
jgi:hypothetical protein